jgi:hypothetical protein
MGVSKRDLNRVKQIINAFPRFERRKWRGRPRPREFVRRDYFSETLEFYRIVAESHHHDPNIYRLWVQRLMESRTERGRRRPKPSGGPGQKTAPQGRQTAPTKRRRQKRRRRKGSKPPPSQA